MLLVLPIVVPLLTACLCLLFGHRERTQRALATAGACGLLLSAILLFARVWAGGPFVLYVGGWRAPFGITFVADVFAALMVLVAALVDLDQQADAQGVHEQLQSLRPNFDLNRYLELIAPIADPAQVARLVRAFAQVGVQA